MSTYITPPEFKKPENEFVFSGHQREVYCTYFSPDQTKISSVGTDGIVHVWNISNQNYKKNSEYTAHNQKIYSCCYSLNGDFLATGSYDRTVRMFDCESEKFMMVFKGHTAYVRCVHFSPHDDDKLYSGSSDGRIKIWNIERNKILSTIDAKKGRVYDLEFHKKDDSILLSAHFNSVAKMWDLRSEKCIHTFPHGHYPLSLKVSPADSNMFASSCGDGKVTLFDFRTYKSLHQFHQHSHWVRSISFHPNGNFIASASDDKKIIGYDLIKKKVCFKLTDHKNSVLYVQFSKDGNHFVSGSWDSKVIYWKSNIKWVENIFQERDEEERLLFLTDIFSEEKEFLVQIGEELSFYLPRLLF